MMMMMMMRCGALRLCVTVRYIDALRPPAASCRGRQLTPCS